MNNAQDDAPAHSSNRDPVTVNLGPPSKQAPAPQPAHASLHKSASNRGLMIGALGVVFGDIGTSPLYAFRECLDPKHGIATTPDNILGLLSVILWSLILVISVKYVGLIMRADNRGEGGVLALSTLLLGVTRNWRFWAPISAMGLLGAALFFGDGIITPAVSILGALEGLNVADASGTAHLERLIIPGAVVIVAALFFAQKRGTGAMGKAFGPVMVVWFAVLGLLGLLGILESPQVLYAVNPLYAFSFFARNGVAGFVILSSVFLAVTGGEALYADMGHFGRPPISRAWFRIVLPCLILNYFGQGALVLHDVKAIDNPFYHLAPTWSLPLMIVLAAAATVIASQAVISGVFSVTSQAQNLGYLPRLRILHSSEEEIGQVYVPSINWLLCVGTLLLIFGFGSSSALAGAYGIAVSSTMLIAALEVILLLRFTRAPHSNAKIGVLSAIAILDLLFFTSNLLKFPDGGWLPIMVGIIAFILMSAWSEGRRTMSWLVAREQTPMRDFLAELETHPPQMVPGTAIYLVSDASGVPRALSQNIRFNHVMHERTILLSFLHPEVPHVLPSERIEVQVVAPCIQRVIARYGFMETPNAVAALRAAVEHGIAYRPEETTYVIGHDSPVITNASGMAKWRKRLFAFMSRNSQMAAEHYGVPAHRVLEMGSQVKF